MIDRLPNMVTGEDSCELSFGAIPFWQGVQKSPGVRLSHALSLRAQRGQPIRQATDASVIDAVVDAYQSEEYAFITAPPGASAWANSLGDSSVSAVIEAVKQCKPRQILEIGAGSGYVARRLMERYRPDQYVIVDPTIREIVEGAEVIREYFPGPGLGARGFDLVLAFNCLEHVPEPTEFLRTIGAHLLPEGKVVLIFPDCEEQLRRGDLNVLLHEHISYFTEASARAIMLESGFTVDALESRHDTLFVALSKASKPPANTPGTDQVDLMRQSARAFQIVLADTVNSIRQRLDAGEKVGFHGATNGLNIMLQLSSLGAHPGVQLYDGDASKHGMYLPACAAPIMNPVDPTYRDNALVVVSAMSYFDPISRFAREAHGLDAAWLLPLAGA